MDDLYREQLLEHYKNPSNYGKVLNAHISKEDSNPLCGDVVEVSVRLDKNKNISDIKFTGKGCVISVASADILSDELKGKNIDDAKKMTREEMLDLLGLNLTPTRVKCAMLALTTIKKGIMEYESRALNENDRKSNMRNVQPRTPSEKSIPTILKKTIKELQRAKRMTSVKKK